MFVLGLGLGLVMQVLVLAVQNAVDYAELGVATSGATLFRSIGGSLGTAVLGAIFTNRLTDELAGSPAARGRQRLDRPERARAAARPRCATATSAPSPTRCSTVFLVAAAIVAGRLPAVVADRGAAAAQDGRHGRRGRGVRDAEERRLAARAHARAGPAGRPRAHARVHRAHGRRRRRRPAARSPRGCSCRARRALTLHDPEAIAAGRPFDAARATAAARRARRARPDRRRRAHRDRPRHGRAPDRRPPRRASTR